MTNARTHHSCRLLVLLLVSLVGSVAHADSHEKEDSQWYRGNMHTHSLWSDGNDFPDMIADWYKRHGYHFLVLTDHNILSRGERWMKHAAIVKRGGGDALQEYRKRYGDEWVETRGTEGESDFEIRLRGLEEFRGHVEEPGKFLMIEGEEISDSVDGLPIHLNASHLAELIPPQGGRTVVEAIDANLRAAEEQARRLGRDILVHLNHPNFGYAITAEDLAAVLREQFVEVYNGHPGVEHLGDEYHVSVEKIWDIANTIRIAQLSAPPLMGLATDDSHAHHDGETGSRPGRGWVWVRASELTPEAVIQAMQAGDFYASSGVTLEDVQYDEQEKRIELKIAADGDATYTTEFIGTPRDYDAFSEPRLDSQGEPIRATRRYSDEVGKVFKTVEGRNPTYELTGDELYVRAVVTSSRPHPDPSFKDQKEQAWTQPVMP